MQSTVNYGWQVPSDNDTDLLDSDLWTIPIKAIDSAMKALDTAYKNADTALSGRVTKLENATTGNVTTGLTVPADWTLLSFSADKMGKLAAVNITVTKKTAATAFTTASGAHAGNLVGDPLVCTIPAGYRPANTQAVIGSSSFGSWGVRINTDGTCNLFDGPPGACIDVTENLTITASYFIP